MPVLKPQSLIDERVAALRKAHADAHIDRAELDLSGGIDSAVMACLLVKALGPHQVAMVHTIFKTNPEQTARAGALARALGADLICLDLSGLFDTLTSQMIDGIVAAHTARIQFTSDLIPKGYAFPDGTCRKLPALLDDMTDQIKARCKKDPTILGSIRSTLRAPIGRGINRLTGGGIRHGTGNECEDRFIRFYQKGGDGEVDSNPIDFLSKGEVYQLALALGKDMGPEVMAALLPIIGATPSPDLWGTGDAHSDESELLKWLGVPFTYSRISVETGKYVTVGTIERVARFLDSTVCIPDALRTTPKMWERVEYLMFGEAEPNWGLLVARATETYFPEFTVVEVEAFLKAARKAEAATRHKMNPNCPAYGDRRTLVEAGILTNLLPL